MQRADTPAVDSLSHKTESARATLTEGPRTFGITANETEFSMAKVCSFRHNYHEHPLMQLDSLRQLAKFLMRRGLCRFIPSHTTQGSQFAPAIQSYEGRGI